MRNVFHPMNLHSSDHQDVHNAAAGSTFELSAAQRIDDELEIEYIRLKEDHDAYFQRISQLEEAVLRLSSRIRRQDDKLKWLRSQRFILAGIVRAQGIVIGHAMVLLARFAKIYRGGL
jgi:hypothetical protein